MTAHAQVLSGDFRNTTLEIGEGLEGDLPLNVQQDSDVKCAEAGVTVEVGDAVSFDWNGTLATNTAGFWRGKKGKEYSVRLYNAAGRYVAIVELKGLVRWNTDRNVTDGNENFLRISTDPKTDEFVKIGARGTKDGSLHIAADGVFYRIYDLSCDFSASADKVGNFLRALKAIEGKVASVTMEVVAGPKSILDTTLDLSEKDAKSTVVITLEGKPNQEFRILMADIVTVDGFTDLNGRHETLGGLFIFSDLRKRLKGKNVVLRCRVIEGEKDAVVYGVATLEVRKVTSPPEPASKAEGKKSGGKKKTGKGGNKTGNEGP
jgi:hypothetical protein